MANSTAGKVMSTVGQQMGVNLDLIFGAIGAALANKDYEEARRIYRDAVADIDSEKIPEFKALLSQELNGQREVSMGSEGRTAQQGAIRNLQGFVDQGGLDAQARGQLQEAQSRMGQEERGQREAIGQSMARRGMSGSGNELSMMLQGQSAAANEGRNASLGIAGQARSRALQALQSQAGIAGQMRGQDVGIEENNAAAERERQAFNAKMRMATQVGNNQGRLAFAGARLNRIGMLNHARGDLAENLTQGGNRSARYWSGVGQGMNAKMQMLADDADENM